MIGRTVIAVLGGTGAEGSGLALRWAAHGHEVLIGSRSIERAQATAQQIAAKAGASARVRGASNLEAAGSASVIVLTVPPTAQLATAEEVRPALTGKLLIIKKFFLPFGSVQLHGCNVGQGSRGKELLQKLAKLWEVPVTAGVNTQFSGGAKTFKFEGPTVTKYPGGGNLKAWSKIMENLHGNVSLPT